MVSRICPDHLIRPTWKIQDTVFIRKFVLCDFIIQYMLFVLFVQYSPEFLVSGIYPVLFVQNTMSWICPNFFLCFSCEKIPDSMHILSFFRYFMKYQTLYEKECPKLFTETSGLNFIQSPLEWNLSQTYSKNFCRRTCNFFLYCCSKS